MRDAEMAHPAARGRVVSHARLALKLYKGAQSDWSNTIKLNALAADLDRVALGQRGRGAAV